MQGMPCDIWVEVVTQALDEPHRWGWSCLNRATAGNVRENKCPETISINEK